MAFASLDDEWRRYLFEYRHNGSEWGIEVLANSPQDAKERLNALNWANYKGEIAAKIPVPGAGLFARILARLR
jgi:hypothetical protein